MVLGASTRLGAGGVGGDGLLASSILNVCFASLPRKRGWVGLAWWRLE